LAEDPFDAIEKRILKEQVVDRIGRQAELGKNHQGGFERIPFPRKTNCLTEIGGDIGHFGARHTRRNPNEVMAIQRMKRRGHDRMATDFCFLTRRPLSVRIPTY
jgi:hypothetical protein